MRGARALVAVTTVAAMLVCGSTTLWAQRESGGEGATNRLAQSLVKQAGVDRGICSIVGADADLALALVRNSRWLIHVRDSDRERLSALRLAAQETGIGIDRLIFGRGELDTLPFADNLIDVVIAPSAGTLINDPSTAQEVARVLRPGGRAIVGKALISDGPDIPAAQLSQWAAGVDRADPSIREDETGTWVQFAKPIPQNIDEWTHWEHGPDNNPVSSDNMIRFPYMTQFMADPKYIGMPSITTAAGGRTFLAIGHIAHHPREWDTLYRLIARNGYNGTVLWERKLPEGYAVHRSAFIAGAETFYMIDGPRCLLLDAATGQENGEIRFAEVDGHWHWMAMKDGILYALVGDPGPGTQITKGDRAFGGWSWADLSPEYYEQRMPLGYGHTLVAYDLGAQEIKWTHREDSPIDSRAMALRDDHAYLLCPEKHVRCLALDSGEVQWTNAEANIRELIEQPGNGLTSTPGFRTACLVVATPDALIIQGQTRMNVVALSTKDGYILWTKRKITNNPNAIYIDGKVILGVGERGSHVVIDPVSGAVEEDLKFLKRACTRLTASGDSLFCRGEGTLRFDRETKKVLIDGAQRPACNDGALPAHGLLYLGPWQCDCNLTLIGHIAKCSAGDFRFDHVATDAQRLETFGSDSVAEFIVDERDWPTYRGTNHRSGGTSVPVQRPAPHHWRFSPPVPVTPVPPVAAGGLVFVAGSDGVIRAIDSTNGILKWQFATDGPINSSPSLGDGRVYVGSSDGYAYCLEAQTGRLVWRFRGAPVERDIMVFDRLVSTWPVNSGVMIHNDTAYFAAGIIDHDGTYVYAVDARTGQLKWQNNSSGHLNAELRKGVSVQGNLSVLGDQLLLAGGNQVSPAVFDINTGECRARSFAQGQPKANAGRYLGVFADVSVITGGRIFYSSPDNVATKGYFAAFGRKGAFRFTNGGIPPAWNDDTLALVNFKNGKLTVCDTDSVATRIDAGLENPNPPGRQRFLATLSQALEDGEGVRWSTDMDQPNKFETTAAAVAPNAVVAVVKFQQIFRSQPQWFLVAFNTKTGQQMFQHELRNDPLPDGLLIDRTGQIVLVTTDGQVECFGK